MSDRFGITQHKLLYHPQRISQWLEAGQDWEKAKQIYPIFVEVSPVGACNHRCTFCSMDYVGYKSVRLSAPLISGRLKEMAELGVKGVMFSGEGEPLLHRNIVDIVQATHQAGMDISFTTNAVNMDEHFIHNALPLISWIKVSINAGTAGTYGKIHRTKVDDFRILISNLRKAVEFRNQHKINCTIGAQALLLPENAKEMEQLAFMCREQIGLDYLAIEPYVQHHKSKTKPYQDIDYLPYFSLGKKLAKVNSERFQVYFHKKPMKNQQAERNYRICHATPFFWAYIMADGSVYGCNDHLLEDRFNYGNLNDYSFQKIWQGERRRLAVEFVQNRLDVGHCSKNCRMDAANTYLDGILQQHVPLMNFI